MDKYYWNEYENFAEELIGQNDTKGVIVALSQYGKELYTKSFGFRDEESKLSIDSDTIFGIGSITKSFTAVCIMKLQEQGKLRVDELVKKYLPNFRFGNGVEEEITIHHLLTHTAGMPPLGTLGRALARSFWEDEVLMQDDKKAKEYKELGPIDNLDQLVSCIAEDDSEPLGFPGEHFSYSNDSWALLGAIIEKVSGMSYENYVKTHILLPLGMNRSVFDKDELEELDNVATLYHLDIEDGQERIIHSPSWWEAPSMTAAGFLKSSATDMLKYADIFCSKRVDNTQDIISKESIRHLCAPYASPISGQPLEYGYGLMIHLNYNGYSLVEHGGNIKGVAAWMTCVPEEGISAIVLTNTSGAPARDLVLGAINVILVLPVDTKRQKHDYYNCPQSKLNDYIGIYGSPEGTKIEVSLSNNQLIYETNGISMMARPVGVDLFTTTKNGVENLSRFLRDRTGKVWAVASGFRIIPKLRNDNDS